MLLVSSVKWRTRRKKVVVIRVNAQYSNRLWQNLWLESYCHQQGIEYVNHAMSEVSFIWGGHGSWLSRLQAFVLFWLHRFHLLPVFRFDDEKKLEDYKRHLTQTPFRTLFVAGWGFRSPETVKLYAPYFRDKYRPRLAKSTQDEFESLVKGFDYVLGVHMRGKDYRLWRDGQYYYPPSQYRSWIDQFVELQGSKRGKVLLFSDEPINDKWFSSLEVPWTISKGSFDQDYYLMSRCSHLIGPPSTFTLWASFLGDNTCIQLQSQDETMTQALAQHVVSPYFG